MYLTRSANMLTRDVSVVRILSWLAVAGVATGIVSCGKEVVNTRKQDDLAERVSKLEKQPTPAPGKDGQPGERGFPGMAGEVGQRGEVGPVGPAGRDGADAPLSVVAILNPCGDAPGIYDEVFLKMQNGTIVASFSDTASGQNTRFSVLTPGNYETSDGDACYFTVDANNNITNEHH
jgi:hypothetical protein